MGQYSIWGLVFVNIAPGSNPKILLVGGVLWHLRGPQNAERFGEKISLKSSKGWLRETRIIKLVILPLLVTIKSQTVFYRGAWAKIYGGR